MSIFASFKQFAKRIQNKRILKHLRKVSVIGENVLVNSASGIRNTGSKNAVTIDSHCAFFGFIYALCGGQISIGDHTYIGTKTCLMAKEKITIGKYAIIANDVVICDNNNHPIDPELRMQMSLCDDYIHDEKWSWKDAASAPIVIEDNTWIGRRAMIMKGVTVGKGSIVGAGAVVTHDVPPYTVVAGNPAKVVKQLKPVQTATERT